MQKLLLVLFALGLCGTPLSAFAQEATPTAPPASEAKVFLPNGERAGSIELVSLVDPFVEFDASSPPSRGYRWVMAVVTVTAGEYAWGVSTYGFRIVDSAGFVAPSAYANRAEAARADLPDLSPEPVSPGKSITGALFFQVYSRSDVATLEYIGSGEFAIDVADLRAGRVAPGEVVQITGNDEAPIAAISVQGGVDPVSDYDPAGSSPGRGFRFVGVWVTIENTGTRTLTVDSSNFAGVDEQGYVVATTYGSRTDAGQLALPDLPYVDLAPGQAASGLVRFSMIAAATLSSVVYSPAYEQRVRVAEVTPGERIPSLDLAALPGSDPLCAGVAEWVVALNPEVVAVGRTLEAIRAADPNASETPRLLRDAAADLRASATAISEISTPESAQPFMQEIVAALGGIADRTDLMAAAAEQGDEDLFELGIEVIAVIEHGLENGAFVDLQAQCPGAFA